MPSASVETAPISARIDRTIAVLLEETASSLIEKFEILHQLSAEKCHRSARFQNLSEQEAFDPFDLLEDLSKDLEHVGRERVLSEQMYSVVRLGIETLRVKCGQGRSIPEIDIARAAGGLSSLLLVSAHVRKSCAYLEGGNFTEYSAELRRASEIAAQVVGASHELTRILSAKRSG